LLESCRIAVWLLPVVIPEHLLGNVALKVERLDADVSALDRPLEQTPKVFESVCVNTSANVSESMVNRLVLVTGTQRVVRHERICIDRSFLFDVLHDFGLQGSSLAICYDGGADFTTTLKQSENGGLVFGASASDSSSVLFGVHVSCFSADESFVCLDFLVLPAELPERDGFHSETNAVHHKPRRLLCDSDGASNLVRTDSVFAVGEHPHRGEPLVERDWRVLENGSDFRGELSLRVDALALPLALIGEEYDILAPAGGAFHSTRPAQLDHVGQRVVRIREENDGLLKCLWLVHGVPHKPNVSKGV